MAVTVTKEGDVFRFSGRAFDITKAKNEALEPYGCRVHNYGLVLELIPDDSQRAGFAQQIGNARFMRNQYLNDRIAYYKETRKTLPVDVYKKKYLLLNGSRQGIPILQSGQVTISAWKSMTDCHISSCRKSAWYGLSCRKSRPFKPWCRMGHPSFPLQ